MANTMVEDARLARVTELCLALPEAARDYNGQHASFNVRGKKFAYYLVDHHGDGMVALNVKAASGENHALIATYPDHYYMPAYVGPRGWVGLRFDLGAIDWTEVADLITAAYRLAAPKRLATRAQTPQR